MPIDTLDPRPALLIVDLQRGTLGNPLVHPAAQIVTRASELLAAFRARELPVVFATVDGTPGGRNDYGGIARQYPPEFAEQAPELAPRADELVITRATWSAFTGTELAEHLASRGVTQLVIAGLATSFGVESTARQAYDLGLHVVLAVDAMSDMRAEAHENSVGRIFPLIGQTGTTAEIVALVLRG